uniref:WAT1-related protein n=1 Tax=Populus alba TaxID=43335 RepID=A0A4U5MZI0_POPAL|nr:hypothetical protein D5086_0000283500 [Populus alba]
MQACAPYAAMLLVQFAYGGSNILMKIALEKGLNQIVFVVYRHLIAVILLGPFAYVIERMEKVKTASPRGRAKMLGTAIWISGSLHAKENWIKGSALILTSHVAWSAWLILQNYCNMEAGLECAAPDHFILWSCELSVSLLPANLVY